MPLGSARQSKGLLKRGAPFYLGCCSQPEFLGRGGRGGREGCAPNLYGLAFTAFGRGRRAGARRGGPGGPGGERIPRNQG